MLTDDQIIDELRGAFAAETDGIDPRPGLLGRVHQELAAIPAGRRGPHRRQFLAEAMFTALAAGVALGVVAIAVVFLHHSTNPNPNQASPVAVGTVRIAAQAPDPQGGLPWGIRTIQTPRLGACVQIGRLQSGKIGALGQDGAFANDHRFHPISLQTNFPCDQTDAHGYLFLNVFERQVPASASLGNPAGCPVNQPRSRRHPHGRQPRQLPACPGRDLRNVAYGALGPEAVSITYSVNHHNVTERTGPDGAYLAVVPATKQSCTFNARGGERCLLGSGEITTPTLQSGVITSVTYRDGHICQLPTPTPTGVATVSCPNIGYTHYPPFHPPHITAAQVAAPVTIRMFTAKRYCYQPARSTGFLIPCDHGIPPGYKPGSWASRSRALIDISFTARVAADNRHSVYEWSLGRSSGPASCTVNTGGISATTMSPIRSAEHVTLQDDWEVCPGTYTGLVSYQPNGYPGRDTLEWSHPIRDHSTIVGRFTYVVR